MSTKEAVTIVSRALSIYFLAWLLSDLTYLPSHLHSLMHYGAGVDAARDTAYFSYMRQSNVISMMFLIFRMIALFFAVQWFYRAGPRIHSYFLTESEGDERH